MNLRLRLAGPFTPLVLTVAAREPGAIELKFGGGRASDQQSDSEKAKRDIKAQGKERTGGAP